jgi:RNA polymerase sigma-70 factor (ECF subfamily)
MARDGTTYESLEEVAGAQATDVETDMALIRRMIDGSEDAVAALYDRHSQAVFAAAIRASSDRGMAADVVQETFLVLWNQAERFDPSRGALASWLVTIARNRAIDHLRAAGRHDRAVSFSSFGRDGAEERDVVERLAATGELVAAAAPELDPELAVADLETSASIRDAIASLSPIERRVILLAYQAGLSQSEIAVRLSWPIGTVKTRTRRALRHLRDRLEQPRVMPASPKPPVQFSSLRACSMS